MLQHGRAVRQLEPSLVVKMGSEQSICTYDRGMPSVAATAITILSGRRHP